MHNLDFLGIYWLVFYIVLYIYFVLKMSIYVCIWKIGEKRAISHRNSCASLDVFLKTALMHIFYPEITVSSIYRVVRDRLMRISEMWISKFSFRAFYGILLKARTIQSCYTFFLVHAHFNWLPWQNDDQASEEKNIRNEKKNELEQSSEFSMKNLRVL